MSSTMLLVDGNNILRSAMAVHIGADLSTTGGVSTGPLMIFINRIARYVRELRPHRLIVAWDSAGPNRRTALLPTYKGNRKTAPTEEQERRESHFALAKEFCAVAGIHQLTLPGFEADDIIAGAWATADPGNGVDRIVIVSNDGDFYQLLGQSPNGLETEQVRLTPNQSKLDRLTANRICAEMGVQHPSDLGRIKVLTGDTSDNVPGIRGIGPKRAIKMLSDNLWSLDEIARVRPEHRALIDLNRQLVDLRMQRLTVSAPLWQPTHHGSLAFETLVEFLQRYELQNVLDRLMGNTLWVDHGEDAPKIGKRLRLGARHD